MRFFRVAKILLFCIKIQKSSKYEMREVLSQTEPLNKLKEKPIRESKHKKPIGFLWESFSELLKFIAKVNFL